MKKRHRTREEWDKIKLDIKKAEVGVDIKKPIKKKRVNKVLILLPITAAIIIALVYIFLIGKWM
jgi:cytochrome c-type biogenesis protein CcmH/NrfG